MQMSEAAVLKEVQGVEEANKLLTAGWRLLDVTVKTNPRDEYQYTYFVLGRPAEPKPKEPNEFSPCEFHRVTRNGVYGESTTTFAQSVGTLFIGLGNLPHLSWCTKTHVTG